MRGFLAVLLAVASLVWMGESEASSARCEGCSDTQFRDKALSFGVGVHLLTSFSTNQIRMYEVRDTSGGEPGVPSSLRTVQVPVDTDIKQLFHEVQPFYAMSNGTMKAAVVVRASDLGLPQAQGKTAFNVMTDVNLKTQLGNRLANGPLPGLANLDRIGEQILQGVLGFFGAGDASLEVTVLMADGSTVVYKLETIGGTGRYIEGRSLTTDGEVIPESNTVSNQGTWSGSQIGNLATYMSQIGATVNYVHGSGASAGTFVCTWNGQTLHCKLRLK